MYFLFVLGLNKEDPIHRGLHPKIRHWPLHWTMLQCLTTDKDNKATIPSRNLTIAYKIE